MCAATGKGRYHGLPDSVRAKMDRIEAKLDRIIKDRDEAKALAKMNAELRFGQFMTLHGGEPEGR